jgi:hypothetical protein
MRSKRRYVWLPALAARVVQAGPGVQQRLFQQPGKASQLGANAQLPAEHVAEEEGVLGPFQRAGRHGEGGQRAELAVQLGHEPLQAAIAGWGEALAGEVDACLRAPP